MSCGVRGSRARECPGRPMPICCYTEELCYVNPGSRCRGRLLVVIALAPSAWFLDASIASKARVASLGLRGHEL